MKRIVLRKAGDVGSIIFTSIEVLAKQIADEKRAREQAEAECARLAEQLKLAQEREFGTSSEQKLQVSNPGTEADSPPTTKDDAEPKKKLRLAASGGGRKPLATPSQPVDPFGLFVFVGADAAKTLLQAT